ncbi:hypothetical protein [Embleya sp. AB8]|uniref:hypothetical protein n=1 Tax=Embleya sp. AB8 TaxID=3156304 RepID=UPI003C7163BD
MLESLRQRFARESVTPLEYIIPRAGGSETRRIDAWEVNLRLGSVLPIAALSWWAASPGDTTRPTAVGLVLTGTAFLGGSTIRWVRIHRR